MDWNLEVDEILASWAVEPAPLEDNPRLLALVRTAKRKLNKAVANINQRIPLEPDLQDALNFVASSAIQRAWYEDPRNIVSESEGIGAFSGSYNKRDTTLKGIYFTQSELSDLVDSTKQNSLIGTITMGKVNPNYGLDLYPWAGNYPTSYPIYRDSFGGF